MFQCCIEVNAALFSGPPSANVALRLIVASRTWLCVFEWARALSLRPEHGGASIALIVGILLCVVPLVMSVAYCLRFICTNPDAQAGLGTSLQLWNVL